MITIGLAVIVLQRQFALGCRGTVLPELFDGMDRQAIARRAKDDPYQFAILKSRVESFEPGKLLPHGLDVCCERRIAEQVPDMSGDRLPADFTRK